MVMLAARPTRAASLITRTRFIINRRADDPRSARPFSGSAVTTLSEGLLDLAIALPLPATWAPYSTTIILATIASRLFLNVPFSIWVRVLTYTLRGY